MNASTDRDQKAYDCLVSHLDNPMFVVTAATEYERAGCLVGFVTRCSIEPRRWYVALSKVNHTFHVSVQADLLIVHALSPAHVELARLFGEETGDEVDKFSRCRWQPGPDGRTPVLTDCPRWFAGEVVGRVDPGDHLGLLLAPVTAECRDHAPQLGFQALRQLDPGHPT